MISARVIAGFGVSSAYDAYTIDRAGPLPCATHCSQAETAFVHGDAARLTGAVSVSSAAGMTSKLRMIFILE
jgi:hypothetical protein